MIYARSDVMQVSIGQAHGGCGQRHDRPVDAAGVPVQPWGLSCAGGCEDFLRSDQHWSVTIMDIPETHDEQKAREGITRHSRQEKESLVALALAKLAGFDMASLPASMTRGALAAAPVAAMLACPAGHAQPAGHNFCGTCGAAMRGAVPAAAVTAGTAA